MPSNTTALLIQEQPSLAKTLADAIDRSFQVYEDVLEERTRQCELKLAGRFKHCCDSLEISAAMKLTILMEEVGEVAREIFEMHDKNDFTPERRAALRKELIQVAAVTIAWLETPDQL